MSTTNFHVSFGSPNIRTVKKWGTPQMVADGYSAKIRVDPVTGEPVGQFALVQVYQLDSSGRYIGSMAANQTYKSLTRIEMITIAAQQTPDECTVDQKMVWLTDGCDGDWGAVIKCSTDWQTTTDAKLIGAVYAGQPVEVLEQRTFTNVLWQGNIEASVPMSRIQVGTIQKVTVVDKNDNYGERPKGVIYLPLWFRETPWIFDRWLE